MLLQQLMYMDHLEDSPANTTEKSLHIQSQGPAKVFQGITRITKDHVKDKDEFIRLWSHECLRVFHDRLTTSEDRDFFTQWL